MGGWEGQAMVVNKKQLPAFTHHMTQTHPRAPAVCEKNIFHLFHSTQPVENHPCSSDINLLVAVNLEKSSPTLFDIFFKYDCLFRSITTVA